MPAPAAALAAAERLSGLIALVRAKSAWTVDNLVAALLPSDLDGSYAVAEPAALASIVGAHTRGAQESIRAALAGIGAWTGQTLALSTVPDVPEGLLLKPADLAAVLRQTVLVESKYRIGTGMEPAAALESARLRAGRATANIGADTARGSYTHTIADAGMAWARVPSANACPFCLLMGARGAIYRTEDTAKGKDGHYHPWDRCRTLAVPRGTHFEDYLDDPTIRNLVVGADDAYHSQNGGMQGYLATPFADKQNQIRAAAAKPPTGSGEGAPIMPSPPKGGGAAGGGPRIPTPRAGGSSGGKPPKRGRGVGADGEPLWPSGGEVPTADDLRAHKLVGEDWEHFSTPEKVRDGTAVKEIAIAERIEELYLDRVHSVGKDPRAFAKTPDAIWRGRPVEFKTLEAGSQNAIDANLQEAGWKARHAVLDLSRVGLSEDDAMALFRAAPRRYTGRLDSILLLGGDSPETSWARWAKGARP